MATETLTLAVEDEDERCRAEVKQVCYDFESHGDPKRLHEEVEAVLEASKERLSAIFARLWGPQQAVA